MGSWMIDRPHRKSWVASTLSLGHLHPTKTTVGRAYGRSLIFIALLIGLALVIDKFHAPKSTTYHYYVYMCAVASGT